MRALYFLFFDALRVLLEHGQLSFFNRDDARANLFIMLSAADADSHLEMLVKISELLQDEATAEKIFAAQTVDELYACFAD